ncbi:MAG TPA: SemiSWEET family transporter [Chitinophagaceae bacterium]|nr:SemiSWEET family transporter [Chitinophagaceae bacterium]
MDWINVVGYTAGTLSAITFLPQVIKTWKMKAAGELSFGMILLVTGSVSMWICYGLLLKNNVIIITNSVVFILSLFLIYFKMNYKE